jgi:hypothetical protein
MHVLYGYLYIILKVRAYKHLKLVHTCNSTRSKQYIARLPNKMFVRFKYISHASPFSPSKKCMCIYTSVALKTNPSLRKLSLNVHVCVYTYSYVLIHAHLLFVF